jgi:hypothetical protein
LLKRENGQLDEGGKDLKAESVRIKDIAEGLAEAVLR